MNQHMVSRSFSESAESCTVCREDTVRILVFSLALSSACSWAPGVYNFQLAASSILEDTCGLGDGIVKQAIYFDINGDVATLYANPENSTTGLVLTDGVDFTIDEEGVYHGEWSFDIPQTRPPIIDILRKNGGRMSSNSLGPCVLTNSGTGELTRSFDASVELFETGVFTVSGDCTGIALPPLPCAYKVQYQGISELYY